MPWTRSAVRGLALLLAVALALAGYWAWSGRPRAVAMAPDVLATGAPFPVDAAAVLEPPGAAGSPGVAPDVSGGGTSPASAEGETGPNVLMTPGSPTGSGPGPSTAGRPELVVHVAGLVSRPGLVRLPAGSRVADAVAAAGGVTKRRAADTVNLARLVVEGEQIVVGGAASGQASVVGPMAASDATPPPLDLNAATQDELEGLPGIGPVIAARIIGWRTTNGAFRSVEELGEVSGIGTAILSQVRTLVRV